ncbi:MAG: hypothetical protein ACFFCM_05925 [Promethearchaeota archaeon]
MSKNNIKEKTEKSTNVKKYGTLVGIDGRIGYVLAKKIEKKDQNIEIPSTIPFFLETDSCYIFIYKHIFAGPDQTLPSFYFERKDGSMMLIDPARKILINSSLTSYSSEGILIPKENKFMDILEPLTSLIISDNTEKFQEIFKISNFNFFNYLPNYINDENMSDIFIQFLDKYGSILSSKNKEQLLKIIAKLIQKGLDFDNNKIKQVLEFLTNGKTNCLSLGFENNQVVGIVLKEIDLGDLIVFNENNREVVTVFTNSGKTCVFSPLFQLENGEIFNRKVSSLSCGSVGTKNSLSKIFEKFMKLGIDDETIPISIGNVENTKIPYEVLFHPKKINHSIIASISGGGKGNLNKNMITSNAYLGDMERLAMIIFDDVPEFKSNRSNTEWGLECLRGLFPQNFPIEFINPKQESNHRLSLIHITSEELIYQAKGYRAESAFYTAKFLFYQSEEERVPVINGQRRYDIITPDLLQWILFNEECRRQLRDEHYLENSIDVMQRTVRNYIRDNRNFLKAYIDFNNQEIRNDDINNKDNLIDFLLGEIESRKIVIIDQSDLNDVQKLALQRSVINNLLRHRETYTSKQDIEQNIPCQIIIEEATSTMEDQTSDQLRIFRKVLTKARKFGIGLTLILQHTEGLDQRLINQLGWMVALPIPSDGIRSKLIKNAAGDFGPFDVSIKKSTTGQAVLCQNQRLSYLPVPVKVWHYEKRVEELWRKKVGDSSDLVKNSIENILKESGFPIDAINRILMEETQDDS